MIRFLQSFSLPVICTLLLALRSAMTTNMALVDDLRPLAPGEAVEAEGGKIPTVHNLNGSS